MVREFAPPICAKIRTLRDRARKEALAAGDTQRARQLTQEGMAAQLGITVKAYRAYEKDREPDHWRRRDIARALSLPEEYFEPKHEDGQPDRLGSLEERVSSLEKTTWDGLAGLERAIDELSARLPRQGPSARPRAKQAKATGP